MTAVLSYTDGSTVRRSEVLSRIALACGAIPLTVGTSIFLVWLVHRSVDLAFAGLFTILAGVPLSIVGFLCLLGDSVRRRRNGLQPWGSVRKRELLIGLLLLSNYPTAWAIVQAVNWIQPHF